MSTPLESRPWWKDVISKLKSRPLRDLARAHKVSVAELQDALARTGNLPKPGGDAVTSVGVASDVPATEWPAETAPAAAEAASPAPAKKAAAKKGGKAAKGAAAGKKAGASGKKADGTTRAAKKPTAGKSVAPATKRGASSSGSASERLAAIRHLLGTISDGEVAERADVARKTVVEYRKRHGIDRYRGAGEARGAEAASSTGVVAEAALQAEARKARRGRPAKAPAKAAVPAKAVAPAKAPPPAPAADASRGTGRASKLDAYLDIVGHRPDREVADLCGVTPENVRMYRLRRSIPAFWRGEGEAPAAAAKAPVVAEAPAPNATAARTTAVSAAPAAPAPVNKVDRALAPYLDLVGKVPDAEIAQKAGISRSAVSAYRQARGIVAAGRGGAAAAAPAAAAPKAVVAAALVAKAAAPAAKAAAPGGSVFRIVAKRDGEKAVFGVTAADAVEAVRAAHARLTAQDAGWVIHGLRYVGASLPE